MILPIQFHINVSQLIITEIINTFIRNTSILLCNISVDSSNLKQELKNIIECYI
jgi:hypothetical protein